MSDATATDFRVSVEVSKVDEGLGLVLGWGIICKRDGEDYYDLQGHNIEEGVMLDAALDFMKNARLAKEMHTPDERGTVVFAWPMTEDIAKAFGVETRQTGLMIAMYPDTAMLAKFQSGELTGFSLGGNGYEEDAA